MKYSHKNDRLRFVQQVENPSANFIKKTAQAERTYIRLNFLHD